MSWMMRMLISWSLAGGIAGGLLIAGLVITSRLHTMGMPSLVIFVASIGTVLGVVHGAILGHLGRPYGDQRLDRRRGLLLVLAVLASSCTSVGFALWFAISAAAAKVGAPFALFALALTTAAATAIFAWATINGWHAIEIAYARWPEKKLGSSLVLGAFAVLSVVMLSLRGAVPGTQIQLSLTGAALLIGIAVVWIVSPVIIIALKLAGRRAAAHAAAPQS